MERSFLKHTSRPLWEQTKAEVKKNGQIHDGGLWGISWVSSLLVPWTFDFTWMLLFWKSYTKPSILTS